MSFIFEGRNRIYFGSQAMLLENDREMASEWAKDHIKLNPMHAWILGKFVEAERANKNQHWFPLQDLVGNETVVHSPMNINHQANNVVGAFVANEIIYPTTNEGATDLPVHPFMETLSVVWKFYFPAAYDAIQKASKDGALFHSMECVPEAVATVGGQDDSKEYAYAGRQSPMYPAELNDRSVPMKLIRPHFTGGAIVLPPANPAWSAADARQVATFMDNQWEEADITYEAIKAEADHLDPATWEKLMIELLLLDASNPI